MPPRTGFLHRPFGLGGTYKATISFSLENHAWLVDLSKARMVAVSGLVNDAIACYRAAIDREQEAVEREERAARRAESKSLEEDIEP